MPATDPYQIAANVGAKPQSSHFLMCQPKYLSTKVPNNVFMQGENKEKADVPRALNQWDRTAHLFETWGVRIDEIPPTDGCQDQCYVANIGITIHPYFVLANFKAPGRDCEVAPARKFLTGLGYECIQPPDDFEGEADLKLWKPGVYFGGWGLFSSQKAFDWIEEKTGCKIIRVKEINPKTYHLDCNLLVVNEENLIVSKAGLDKESLKTLEGLANVIYTPPGIETTGITNGVLIPEKNVYVSGAFNPEMPDYRKAMEWLLDTMDKLGYTTVFVDVDSYNVSGADLSCSVCHLTFEPTIHRV